MLRASASDIQQWMREAANFVNQIPWRFTPVKTAEYTADYGECVLCDTSGGGFLVYLPRPRDGAKVAVKDATGSASANSIDVRVAIPGTDFVEGNNNLNMTAGWQALTLYADGANWWAL